MASMNNVFLLGNLGKDPEPKTFSNGNKVVNFSLATSKSWKDKSTGEKKTKTEWHNIAIFGPTAEIAEKYLKKGSQVLVKGELQTRSWEDIEGRKCFITEIIVNELIMLGSKGESQPNGPKPVNPYQEASVDGGFDAETDDLPY